MRSKRIVWSTVSNAAVRSRRMRSEGDPASAVVSRSFVTLSKAVSVLWAERNPFFKQVVVFEVVLKLRRNYLL